ncbi:MAG: hypothetical protein IKS75_06220 [Clostridiales bacterium]|nr:hypothetical protein [Clostridiales bacterium]
MKKFTKTIAAFCAMAMTVSVFSAAVFAEGDEEQSEQNVNVEEQENTDSENQKQDGEVNLQYVPEAELNNQASEQRSGPVLIDQDYIDTYGLPTTTGDYALVADVDVYSGVQITESNQNVTIDLNGHKITYHGSESMYVVGLVSGKTVLGTGNVLTIKDTAGDGEITTGSDYVGGGSDDHYVSGGSGVDHNRGGCILIQKDNTAILESGTISNFHAGDEGGGVHASNGAHFVMNGGMITGCSAKNGGGVSCHASSSQSQIRGSFTFNGGEISYNTATELGAGIRINRADFYLFGGVVTENTVTEGTGVNGGGGIQILKGKDTQILQIKGNPLIYDNHCTANQNRANLFFESNFSFKVVGDISGAKITFGVASENTSGEFFVNPDDYSCPEDCFVCDNSGYYPYYNSGNKAIMIQTSVQPSVKGYSLVVGGEIKLRVHIDAGTFANSNTTMSCEYEYSKNNNSTYVYMLFDFAENVGQDGNGYYIFEVPIESACMTAPLEIKVHYGASGEASDGTTVTIEQYATHIINNSSNQKEKDVAEALLIYGGYAQVQFNINTNMLPSINNIDFASSTANYGLQKAAYTAITDPDRAFAGAKLSMLSQTEIKLYFKKSVLGDTAPEMTVSYSSDPIEATPSGSYYIYVIKGPNGNGFSATQYDQTFTFTVGSVSGTYSVETYLKAAKNTSTNQAMLNLAEAYYNFAEKCQAL